MQRMNTIHISVLETRAFPEDAAYITAFCAGQKVKLAGLTKGKLMKEAGGSLVGVESAEALWLNVSDNGITFDSVLGSCMLLLSMFDLHHHPYEGWLPMYTLDGKLTGRIAVQIFGDWSERVNIGIIRANVSAKADLLSAGDPFIELRLRDSKAKTSTQSNTSAPVWNEHFKFSVGSRDKLYLTLMDKDLIGAEKFGTAEVLGLDIIKRKGESLWVPILNLDKEESSKVLISIEADEWQEWLPFRILQAKGLTSTDIGGQTDTYVEGKCGNQTFRTTTKKNTTDAVWDEEFHLEVRHFDALHLKVKDQDILWDDFLGEAFIPISEMFAHLGEQVWVDLTGNGSHKGKLLLWIQPPPGSVYPDTLSRKRLTAYDNIDAARAPMKQIMPAPQHQSHPLHQPHPHPPCPPHHEALPRQQSRDWEHASPETIERYMSYRRGGRGPTPPYGGPEYVLPSRGLYDPCCEGRARVAYDPVYGYQPRF